MGQNDITKILKVYFESGDKSFTVRDLSALTKIPRSTVQNRLKELKNQKLVNEKNMVEGDLFRTKKIHYYIESLVEVGLVDFLVKELNPSCIILFGSFRKGGSVKESDFDIFVESSIKKEINLARFEKMLGHSIDLFVESNISNLQKNLFNNIINGIKLYGNLYVGGRDE